MNGHDFRVLSLIVISALGSLGLTSLLIQPSSRSECRREVRVVQMEIPVVGSEAVEVRPEFAFKWRTRGGPHAFSTTIIEPVRVLEHSLWRTSHPPRGWWAFESHAPGSRKGDVDSSILFQPKR